jgi:hypothetical protein
MVSTEIDSESKEKVRLIPVAGMPCHAQPRSDYACGIEAFKELVKLWQTGHLREHVLLEKAADLARVNLELRLESMNQFRHQLESERGFYVTRTELRSVLIGGGGLLVALGMLLVAYFRH